mmetsp:Transcript_19477/g.42364  ORF Transcript_19477/g.42364 Transcript_19477/m.42364 type:complete len:345 (+) Transcript_19477:205-1239(+)
MATNKNGKEILMTGQTFTVPESERSERPRLTMFPGSLNAQKAHACVRISSLNYADGVDLNLISYPEDNQTLDYARLNPNMSIPTLEIDDKIITDSRDIQRYLFEKYPGEGDAHANKADIETFLDAVCAWDEYLFSYRRIPVFFGEAMHRIRLVWLADAVNSAARDGILEERLRDGQTIRQAYVKKIAQVRALIDVGCKAETPELTKRISENDVLLGKIFSVASDLRNESGGPFLLGPNLTSADAFFAPVVARVEAIDKAKVNSYFDQFRGTREWWETFKTRQEAADAFSKYGKLWTITAMMLQGKPFKILGYKLGVYKPTELPDDIEEDVQKQLQELKSSYLCT